MFSLVIISHIFHCFAIRNLKLKALLSMKINFLLALKCRQFGVKMENGMLSNSGPSFYQFVFFFFPTMFTVIELLNYECPGMMQQLRLIH